MNSHHKHTPPSQKHGAPMHGGHDHHEFTDGGFGHNPSMHEQACRHHGAGAHHSGCKEHPRKAEANCAGDGYKHRRY